MQNPADTINKGFAAGWDMVDKVWEEREKNEIRKAHKSALEDASAKAAQSGKAVTNSDEYNDAMGFSEAFNQQADQLREQDTDKDPAFRERAFANTQAALDSAPGWKPGGDSEATIPATPVVVKPVEVKPVANIKTPTGKDSPLVKTMSLPDDISSYNLNDSKDVHTLEFDKQQLTKADALADKQNATLDETIASLEKGPSKLAGILEPVGAKVVAVPSGIPGVKPRRSVQNIGYYETPKQSAMDIYAKEGVPKIQDKLLAQGKFKEAQAFGEWAKERNNAARGEAYVTALMQAKQGDIHGAVKTMAAIYNRTVPDGQFVRTIPKEGSNELYTVELRDEKTGKLIAPAKEMKVSEIYLSGMANLSPDALFKAEIDQRAAEKKAEADRNKLTVVGNNAINQDGKEVYRGQPTPEKISSVAQLQQEQAALELKLQSLPTTPDYAPLRAKLKQQIRQYDDKLTDKPAVVINTHKPDPFVEIVTKVNPDGSTSEITTKDGNPVKTVIKPPEKDITTERVNAALVFVDKKNEDVPYDVAAMKIQEIAVKHPTMSTANMARYAKQLVIREKYEALRKTNPVLAKKFAAPYVLSGDLILSK
jgi:hypothetical protein